MNTPSPLEAIFFAALEKGTPQERAAYLDEACAGDPDLRRRVEKMLAAQSRADDFLEQPALPSPSLGEGVEGSATLDERLAERPGTMIGPYKLLEQIGEGGFGVVFMADQTEPVRRKVALKILKPGMDTRQVVARFEAERQALAIMDHPNIAKVHDGGATPSGRPYFVMELVKGVPITEFCDAQKLSPRQRLELFIPVCQAVQHAHQKGIIHRDLKPSNILVVMHDTTPVPEVIDFGIAKALGQELTDKTLFTGFAQMVGTPLYMSPEQAGQSGLDIDTRSDIYSLGVLLYELLTGTTPFDKDRFKQAAYDEIRRIIREEDPPKPSTRLSDSKDSLPSISAQRQTEPAKLTKLVRGELDWIVMKALEKDRNRRYETANGFAIDVQRYLADEPVQACPPSMGYRFRKFARRNKRALAMVGCVALALVAGIIISTWQAVRASRAEQTAEANFERARGAVKRMLTRVAQEELVDVPWMESVRSALLKDALEFYEQLLTERPNDPETRLAVAQARLDVAYMSGRWDGPEKSRRETVLQSALNLFESLAAEFPDDPRHRAGMARALRLLSDTTAWNRKRWHEADELLRRAITLQESLVAALPDSVAHASQLAMTLHQRGQALRTGGQLKEAEDVFGRVVSIGADGAAKDPDDLGSLCAQIRGMTRIAEMVQQREPDRAEALLLRAQTLATRFQAARSNTHILFDFAAMTVAGVDQALGALYRQTGRHKEEEAAFRRAVTIYGRFSASFPSSRYYRERLTWTTVNLAWSLAKLEKREEAELRFREAIENFQTLSAGFPKEYHYPTDRARSNRGLAALLDSTGRPAEAEMALRAALDDFLKAIKAHAAADDTVMHQSDAMESRIGAAQVSRHLAARSSRPEDAAQLYRQAATLLEGVVRERSDVAEHRSTLGGTYRDLAMLHCDAGRLEEAEGAVREAVTVFKELVGAFPKERAYRQALANTYEFSVVKIATAAGRPGDVDKAKRAALEIWRKLAADYPDEAQYQHKAGVLLNGLREYDGALALLTRAVELQPDSWNSWHSRGFTHANLGQWDNAVADQTRALALKPDHPWSWHQRGVSRSRLGQFDEAISDLSKAIKLKPDLWFAYHERAVAHGKLGQWEKVIADETMALKFNPKHWGSWWRRGDGHSALKQWDHAVADYGKAIECGATSVQVWVSKAAAHARLDQPEQAVAELRQAVAKGFRDVKQLRNRGDWAALRSREDFQQLVAELETKKK